MGSVIRNFGMCVLLLFLFKQNTAYEMRISDWSADVCSSDLDISSASAFVSCLSSSATCSTAITSLIVSRFRRPGDRDPAVAKGVEAITLSAGCFCLGLHAFGYTVSCDQLADRKSTRLNSSH